MTQVFADDGALVPVTVIQAGPCLVVQKKTAEKDGYDAVQVGLVEKVSNRRITSANRGHFEKAGIPPVRTLVEFDYDGSAKRRRPRAGRHLQARRRHRRHRPVEG